MQRIKAGYTPHGLSQAYSLTLAACQFNQQRVGHLGGDAFHFVGGCRISSLRFGVVWWLAAVHFFPKPSQWLAAEKISLYIGIAEVETSISKKLGG
jgi:hypothetical protein